MNTTIRHGRKILQRLEERCLDRLYRGSMQLWYTQQIGYNFRWWACSISHCLSGPIYPFTLLPPTNTLRLHHSIVMVVVL